MTVTTSAPRTVIVATEGSPASALRACLLDAGCDVVAALATDAPPGPRIIQLRPDLIAVCAALDAWRLVAAVERACRNERKPILVFSDDDADASIDAAMAAGAAGYEVGSLEVRRVAAAVRVTMARFRQQEKLLGELAGANEKLVERKLIDRAKGIVMARHQLGEDEAYQKLRSMAMNKNLKLAELARRLLDVEDLLDR